MASHEGEGGIPGGGKQALAREEAVGNRTCELLTCMAAMCMQVVTPAMASTMP